jgi:hypothetical protein
MAVDVEQLIEDLHNNAEKTEEVIASATLMMDRGNRPTMSMINDWAAMSQEAVRLVELLRTALAWLDPETVTQKEIARIMVAQMRFNEAQQNYIPVIARLKKHLGMIP